MLVSTWVPAPLSLSATQPDQACLGLDDHASIDADDSSMITSGPVPGAGSFVPAPLYPLLLLSLAHAYKKVFATRKFTKMILLDMVYLHLQENQVI
jgi:hypothetical protein